MSAEGIAALAPLAGAVFSAAPAPGGTEMMTSDDDPATAVATPVRDALTNR